MDMLRDLRRKSLQLERADVERFRCPDSNGAGSRFAGSGRRGSLACDSISTDKKGASSNQTGGRFHRWFRHITDATEAYKAREHGRNRRPDGSGNTTINYSSPSAPIGSNSPSLSASSSSAQLAPTAENPEKSKEEEAADDNVSADSGVSLTPGSGECPPQVESASSTTSTGSAGDSQQTSQQPPSSADVHPDAVKKAGDGSGTPTTSGSTSPGSGSAAASPAPQRRLQRVEILKIAEGTPLIDPAEVVVSQGAVLTAEPVLTPLEKLRRKDQLIRTALADKQRLVADILHVPYADLESVASTCTATPFGEGEGEKEARLLVMTAMTQANRLATVLNETLRLTEEEAIAAVSEPAPVLSGSAVNSTTSPRTSRRASRMPGVPTSKLLTISEALNRDLTHLLGIVTSRDEERENLRRELQKTRDQLAELLVLQATPSSLTTSRPASHVSLSDCDTSTVAEQADESVHEAVNSILDSEIENEGNELLVEVESSSAKETPADVIELVTEQCSQVECPDDTNNDQIDLQTVGEESSAPAAEEKPDSVIDVSGSSEA